MLYNYHTHTWRCSHAVGTEEEYIKRAIEGGMKYMGFSDHAPFVFPDGYESGYRVPLAQAKDYVNDIARLREKYRDRLDIKIGFEMEHYPSHFDKMLENAVKAGGEYLILGQHFIYDEHPAGKYTYGNDSSVENLQEYARVVVEAIKSKVFTYVAHPDIKVFTGDISIYREEMRKICVASKENNIPLEINFLGIRDNRKYPNAEFWRIAGEEKSPVTFGCDAHDVISACDKESLKAAKKMVDKYKLNYIGKPEIIDIRR